MRGLLIVLMSATLAATTGFAQSRHGSGGGRSFAGGGYSRGFVGSNRGYVGVGRAYAGGYYGGYGYGAYGYGYGYGLGYPAYYGPSCYSPYYYGAYNCGLPDPRLLCGPDGPHGCTAWSDGTAGRRDCGRRMATFRQALNFYCQPPPSARYNCTNDCISASRSCARTSSPWNRLRSESSTCR